MNNNETNYNYNHHPTEIDKLNELSSEAYSKLSTLRRKLCLKPKYRNQYIIITKILEQLREIDFRENPENIESEEK